MKKYMLLLLSSFLISWVSAQESNSKAFIDAFKPHLGNYYEGTIVAGGKEEDGFTGKRLLMKVLAQKPV